MADPPGGHRRPSRPSAAGWAVLGLLSHAPELSGYELRQWADQSLRYFFQAPATSQIYSELRRLERLGWVESSLAAQSDQRHKRVYRLTTAGETALREHVMAAPFRATVVKDAVVLRVWLGHLTHGAGLMPLLTQYCAELTAVTTEIDEALASTRGIPELAYAAAALRYTGRVQRARVAAATELKRELGLLATRGPGPGRLAYRPAQHPRGRHLTKEVRHGPDTAPGTGSR